MLACHGLNDLYIAPGDPTAVDLSTLTVNDFIGKGQATVLVICAPQGRKSKRFYTYAQFNLHNQDVSMDNITAMSTN